MKPISYFEVSSAMIAFARLLLFFFVFLLVLVMNPVYSQCPESFQCGNLPGLLKFPLSNTKPECGLFMLNCTHPIPKIQLQSGGRWYDILEKRSTNKFLIRDPLLAEYLYSPTCLSLRNLTLPHSPSVSLVISPNLTIFTCYNESFNEEVQEHFLSYQSEKCPLYTVFYQRVTNASAVAETRIPQTCVLVQTPVTNSTQVSSDLFSMLSANFTIEWNVSDECSACHDGGGQCTTNNMNEFLCESERSRRRTVILLHTGITAALTITAILVVFGFIWRKKIVCKSKSESDKDIELFLKKHENLALKRYEYKKLKRITNSFRDNLRKRGYGSVYKGKLEDGRLVAVKILNELKGNGEEFMNEVASISRTSHVNIVSLVGFCFDGSKRALIYEFMPNGSLEKFIHQTALAENRMGWERMFEIAIGIARGLDYLHQGCNTRILHLDIKPHNILLDDDLKPKIADFGLAKLCTNRASIVSMLVARGTIGYIAPEVFCRNFGDVSYKSDVYSYGMMLLEMVGKKKDDPGVDGTSELCFPYNIYRDLKIDVKNAGGEGDMNGHESQYAKRKLTIVGLWCIQTDPKDRPPMSMVLEMLEGKLESLQVPPTPQSSSTATFVPEFSTSGSIYYV